MQRFAVMLGLLALGVGVPGKAAALDQAGYDVEETVGGWTLLCDSERDMGRTEYFDCAVRSMTTPPLIVSSLTGEPVLSLGDGASRARLVVDGRIVELAGCPAGRCPFPPGLEPLRAAVRDGNAVLEIGGDRVPLPPDGLDSAVAAALDRLD